MLQEAGLSNQFNKYNDKDLLVQQVNLDNSNQAIFEDDNIQAAVDNNFITEDDLIIAGYQESPEAISVLNFISDDEKQKARRKISTFQSKDKKKSQAILIFNNSMNLIYTRMITSPKTISIG